jgi:hypothetical protein
MIVMPFMIDSNIPGTDFSRDANNPDFGGVSPNFMANLICVYYGQYSFFQQRKVICHDNIFTFRNFAHFIY